MYNKKESQEIYEENSNKENDKNSLETLSNEKPYQLEIFNLSLILIKPLKNIKREKLSRSESCV